MPRSKKGRPSSADSAQRLANSPWTAPTREEQRRAANILRDQRLAARNRFAVLQDNDNGGEDDDGNNMLENDGKNDDGNNMQRSLYGR